MSFEENVKKLNELVKKLESPDVKIDKASDLFEDAVQIIEDSYKTLDKIKGKITILTDELGEIKEKEFNVKGEKNESE